MGLDQVLIMEHIGLFLMFCFGHFLADYPLQGDYLARAKNHRNPVPGTPWFHAMAAHSGIHAGIVYIITGAWLFMIIEFALHFAIDWMKCEGMFGEGEQAFNTDQLFHVSCKLIYAGLIGIVSVFVGDNIVWWM